MAGYRWVTIVAAAGSAVLCAFAIYFNIMALAKYRTDDFLTATSTDDFTKLGTCVEVITIDQLKVVGYEKNDLTCATDNDKGNQLAMRRTLAVSLHGIYYTYFTASITNPTMTDVTYTVLSATLAGGGANTPQSVNFSVAYDALGMVTEQTVPTSCDSIYGMTGENSITEADATAFLASLRRGRLDEDDDEYADWPLADIPVVCNDVEATTATGSQINVGVALSTLNKQKLYAHCLVQFQFASSGTIPYGGTFGVPLVGERAGPNAFFYPSADGFNKTSDYNTKARMFLGQRFGYCVWAYVPMLLATCYLCADAVVFFLAEATLPDVLLETQTISGDRLAMMRDSLVIAATSKTSRAARFAIGVAAVLVSWLFYGLFVIWPWGFIETRLARPVCEAGEPEHVNEWGYLGTTGGWKSDWDAGWYELATLATQVVVLFLLPFTTTNVFAICNRAGRTDAKRKVSGGNPDIAALVPNKTQYRRLMSLFIWPLLVGAIVLIAGQALSGARFGMAWAEGVVGQQTHTDDTTGEVTLAFNEVTLSEQVYDQTIATLAVTVVVGFTLGVALQRHLINGVGCYSALLFFAWLALVIVFALPLLIYAGMRSIFNQDEANKDCAAFPDTGYDFSRGACEARWWTFLIGGGLVLLTIALITFFGLLEAIPNIVRVRGKAAVRLRGLRGNHSAMYNGNAVYSNAPFQEPGTFDADEHALGGFRSADEGFFNYKTGMSATDAGESNALLYAPRVTFSLPVQGQAVEYVQVARGVRTDAQMRMQR